MFRYWIFESYLVICASKSKSPHLAPITWRRPTVKIRSCLSPTSRCRQRQGRPVSDQYTMHHIVCGCILTTGRVQHLAVKPVAAHSDLTSAAVAGSFGAIQRVSQMLLQIEVRATHESSIPSRRRLRQMSDSTAGCRCPGYGWTRISFDFRSPLAMFSYQIPA